MPDEENLLQEIRDTLVIHVQKVEDILRRVERNEDNVKDLYERVGSLREQNATQSQWMKDMERREVIGLTAITIILGAVTLLTNFFF